MMMNKDFAAFILTNGRPDKVITYDLLRKSGYTGDIYIIIDDLDKKGDEYKEKYGDQVIVFDKKKIAQTFDQADNFDDMRSIVYARNACFDIAEKLGIKYFIQLDDDYVYFSYRFNHNFEYNSATSPILDLDQVFDLMLRFFIDSGATSLAMSQGGDFIGGKESEKAKSVQLLRKCMNSFLCSTDRPFSFIGRINEDVNTYTHKASQGLLFLTTNQISLGQRQTQSTDGGMTGIYADNGTYVKSFYSVIFQPSSVKISIIRGQSHSRLHHRINWRQTVPKILPEKLKKI